MRMGFFKKALVMHLAVFLVTSVPVFAQVKQAVRRPLGIVRFQVNPNVTFPDKLVDQLMEDLVDELTGLKSFSSVKLISSGQTVSSNDDALLLMGVITEYRSPKYTKVATFGIAGSDFITATYKLVDKASGKNILQKQGKSAGTTGLVSAHWNSSTHQLSKSIAKHVKKAL
jgi:hypothetical protein